MWWNRAKPGLKIVHGVVWTIVLEIDTSVFVQLNKMEIEYLFSKGGWHQHVVDDRLFIIKNRWVLKYILLKPQPNLRYKWPCCNEVAVLCKNMWRSKNSSKHSCTVGHTVADGHPRQRLLFNSFIFLISFYLHTALLLCINIISYAVQIIIKEIVVVAKARDRNSRTATLGSVVTRTDRTITKPTATMETT